MAAAVKITDFTYRYPDGTLALESVNIKIDPGEKIALIGPNGAGKSTLLLALGVFIKGTGKITVNSIEANKKNAPQIRKKLGIVLQNPDEQLFMPRLFDDVAFGPLNMGLDEHEVIERTQKALESVGLNELAQKGPHHLSAGQKRSAAIATVLSMEPEIIVMDEPDSNLDPRNRKNLIRILNSLTQTLIIATCSMDFASATCDRAILINSGHVIADGTAEKIMSDQALMEGHGLEVPAKFRKI